MKIRGAGIHLMAWALGLVLGTPLLAACQSTGLQIQVLGSGGPGASSGRASSAYLLWLNGESKVLIDAGGGSKSLFHQSGASLDDIELIAMSHFHPDHAAELPAILWPSGGAFTLAGPQGSVDFPSVETWAELLFQTGGAFAVLADRLDYSPLEVRVDGSTVTSVWNNGEIAVTGMGVPHGDVPTLGYRIDYGELSVAFTSDQNGSNEDFVEFIEDVDYLVIHMAGSEDATGIIASLHARPSVWGKVATAANAAHVIVSHISTSDQNVLDANLAILAANYVGQVTVASDLMCVDVRQ